MIRAVILDFNGVLVDDEHLHFELFRELLAERGVSMSEHAYFSEFVGYDDERCFEEALRRGGQSPSRAEMDDLIARKARRYLERAASELRFFPGAAECVTELARHWPVAINSGALRAEIELALQRLDVLFCVDVIISAEDTESSKPDPEGYLLALDALRGRRGEDLEAAHCLVVEDTTAGVQSAKAAGMWVVGVTNTTGATELRRAGADTVVSGLGELTSASISRMFLPEISP